MSDEEKNLKNFSSGLSLTIKDNPTSISYTKTNKLIAALYMITDIMDTEEPLRNKLRTLGAEIISDTCSLSASNSIGHISVNNKIRVVLSFLDIASTVNMISEMNSSILKKEFLELKQSILEYAQSSQPFGSQTLLSEFFKDESPVESNSSKISRYQSIGHIEPSPRRHATNRIGVQKGSTLLKALSDRISRPNVRYNFVVLKKERQDDIINAIKTYGGNATITNIKNKAQGQLTSCSEKTLQRELVSMVKNGVLKKTGEKRWSRYFLN